MNLKKLFFMLTFVVLFATTAFAQGTLYVDATNGSNAYTGVNEINNPAGTGPKATLAAARALIAEGGTIIIKAGTYNEVLDFSTGLAAGPAPASVVNYTLQLKELNLNTDVVFTGVAGGNHALINKAGLTVTITQFGTTERLLLNPAAAADAQVSLTLGTISMATSAAWSIPLNTGGVLDEVKFFIGTGGTAGGRFSNAAPAISGVAAATGIVLTYTTNANYTAGQEAAYASFGGLGQININTAAAANTITFPGAISFNAANTLDVINVLQGGGSFPSTVNLGLGDIVNAGGGTVTVTGLVSASLDGAGTADIQLSSIVLTTGAGSILLNGGITWTPIANPANQDYAAVSYAVETVGGATGTLSTGAVTLNTFSNTAGQGFSFRFNNIAGATMNVGVVSAPSSGTNNNFGNLSFGNAGTASVAGGSYRGFFSNTAGTTTVTGATTVLGIFTNVGTVALGANTLTLGGNVAHATNGGTVTASTGGITVTATGANSFDGGTLSNVTINGAGGVTTFQTNNVVMTTLTATAGSGIFAIGATITTVNVNGATLLRINDGITVTATDFTESSGTFTLGQGASGVLDIKGNFSRTGGTFNAAAGSLLSFTGTITQNVDGGPLFQVVNLTFTNSVSPINVANTIRVTGTATISTATTVNFGTVNLVLNSATARVINNGIYNTTAGSGGGVILGGGTLVTNGFYGGGQTIEGTGTFSYITVDVALNPNVLPAALTTDAVGTVFGTTFDLTLTGHGITTVGQVIYYEGGGAPGNAPAGYYAVSSIPDVNHIRLYTATATTAVEATTRNFYIVQTARVVNTVTGVKFNGILRMYTGALSVATAGVDFSPFGTSASIVRHVWDYTAPLIAGGIPQSVLVVGAGTWNAAAVQYDLEYATGSALATTAVDVLIGAVEFPVATNLVKNLTISATGPLAVQVTAARTFNGNLNVATGSVLGLTGALTGPAAAGVHVVSGDVLQNAAAVGNKLVLSGGGTLTGGAGNSTISAVDFNSSGTYSTTGMKALGLNAATNSVSILGGAVLNLAMANLGTTAAPNWGDVTNLTVTNGRVNLTGDIDVANLNLTVAAAQTFDFGDFNVWWKSAGTFTGAATSVYLATGATTGGYLQIRANSGINTGGALVPRIVMDPAAAATYTLTLGGNTGFSDIFTNTGDDILELGANTFTLGGTAATWNHGGTATYPSTVGNGIFNVTGNVTANLGANVTLPNLTVNNGANTFTLVDNIAGAGVPNLTITDPAATPGIFTMTAGTITQGFSDISLNDASGGGPTAVFVYAAGTINQSTTKGTAATDAQNGELKFNNAAAQVFNVGTTVLSIPNFTVVGAGGVTLNTANPFTVTQRLVMGASALGFGATGRMTLADEAWVIKNGAANLSHAPTFAGVIDLYYVNAAAAIPTAFEMPAAATTTLRDLFINMTGAAGATDDVDASKNITVNRSLNLMAGDYDFENVAGTIRTLDMVAGTSVVVTEGRLVNSGSATVTTLTGGPVTLTYNNTIARNTSTSEFPATAGFVSTLNVNSNPGAGVVGLTLHATRSVGDFVLNMGTTVANGATAIFNLAGFTLNVTNATSATITRGIIADQTAVGGFYVYGTFNVTGTLTSTANGSIQNLNTTANTATLLGPFGSTDWDGAGGNALVGVPTLTLTGTSSIGNTTGNIFATGPITITGPVNGNITTASNITVAAGGALNAAATLTFNGATGQTLTLNAATTINTLNVTMTGVNPLLNVLGANLTIGNIINFTNGIVNMGTLSTSPTLILPNPTGAANSGLAFNRAGVIATAGNVGHVVGKVQRPALANDGAGGTNGRFEFPVGTLTGQYRPAAITFTPAYVVGNPVGIIVSHIDATPEGQGGLPLNGGNGVTVGAYPSIYWLISTTPTSLTSTQNFDVSLQTNNIGVPYSSDQNLRIIRRQDGNALSNPWSMQGVAGNYANYQVINGTDPTADTTVVARTVSSQGGLVFEGSRFTIGIPARAPIFTAPVLSTFTVAEGATTGNTVQFTAPPLNVNDGAVTYSKVSGPAWATIDATTGLLTMLPGYSDYSATAYSVVIRATTATSGLFSDRTLAVTVTNTNRAPSFTATGAAVQATASVNSGATHTFTYLAVDADTEALTYTVAVDVAPTGTYSIAAALGTFTFAPVFADAGKVFTFTITATDAGALTATTTTAVTVGYPVAVGDVTGNGTIAADDASEILKYVVGLVTFTPQQMYAADVNNDTMVGALDAAWILYYVVNGTWPTAKMSAAMGSVEIGQLQKETEGYLLPINLGQTTGVLSVYAELDVDANVEVLGITARAPQGWISASKIENGKVTIAMAGLEPLKDGSIAYLSLRIINKEANATIFGNANLNDGYSAALNSVTVREIPTEFALSQNYPNPFNPTTSIKFAIPENANVQLNIYNMLGQKVRTIMDGMQDAGYYTVNWDGTNDLGSKVSSGIYIYRISAGKYNATMKMNLLK
ncbi:MAG: FlgD immunoglobulin-like domain containing protein [Melioribacteraceae bacterium]|nr:FlgD immunoglobulin-like domain containing protein [Melioribacteraceae bacterium]